MLYKGRLCNVHNSILLCLAFTYTVIVAFILIASGVCGYVAPGMRVYLLTAIG